MAQESRPTAATRPSKPVDDDLDSPSDWDEEAPTVIAPLPGYSPPSGPKKRSAPNLASPAAASEKKPAAAAGAAIPLGPSGDTPVPGPRIQGLQAPPPPKLSEAAEAILARARARAGGQAPEPVERPSKEPGRPSSRESARDGAKPENLATRLAFEALLDTAKREEKKAAKGIPLAARVQRPTLLSAGISDRDLTIFSRQLATMVNSGMPLYQCLEILCTQTGSPALRDRLDTIRRAVGSGSSFSEALKRHSDVFDELFISLVEAGEVSGALDVILNRLATYIEKANELKKQVKTAMVYPIAIFIVALVVVALLVLKVVPVFEKMFAGVGQALPMQTQLAIGLSGFVRSNFFFLVGAIVLAVMGVGAFYRSPGGRLIVDRLLMRSPVAGDLVRKVAVARFCRTLSTLVTSGVPLLSAMETCTRIAGNRVVEAAIIQARRGIAEGKPLAKPLQQSGVFPDMVCQMITVGETTGSLDSMLTKIADFYEEEVESTVAALASLIEPAMMIFLGVAIGGLLVAMYMPIFSMSSIVGGGP